VGHTADWGFPWNHPGLHGSLPVKKSKEESMPSRNSRDSQAQRRALAEGEERRLEYVATLHPKERDNLDPR
jgi:hypothetical protein